MCVDTLLAFTAIDNQWEERGTSTLQTANATIEKHEKKDINASLSSEENKKSSPIDWQKQNESTPQRSKPNASESDALGNGARKRTRSPLFNAFAGEAFACKRRLFNDGRGRKPWGFYKLNNIYKRTFGQEPIELHRAEGDVLVLARLILHYGQDFLDYARENAKSMDLVPILGS